MTNRYRLLVMHFPFPGLLPGTSRKVKLLFTLLHGLCAVSIIYPYYGPVIHVVAMGIFLLLIRTRLPAEAQVAYHFLIQRLGLIALLTLVMWVLALNNGLGLWHLLYPTLLPLCIADAIQASRGDVGLFYVRGRNA